MAQRIAVAVRDRQLQSLTIGWADPLAALAMAPLVAREGIEALSGRICCAR